MEEAIKPFDKYINDLAKAELDRYLGAIVHEGKEPYPDFYLPPEPILLLDGLGATFNNQDQKRVNKLFQHRITFIVQEYFLILLLIAIYFPCLSQAKPVSLSRAFAYIGAFIFRAAQSRVMHLAQVMSRRRVSPSARKAITSVLPIVHFHS
jgi:hypothetical protein